jgi:hypothetical protein
MHFFILLDSSWWWSSSRFCWLGKNWCNYIVLYLIVGGYLIANMAARLDCTDLSDMFLIWNSPFNPFEMKLPTINQRATLQGTLFNHFLTPFGIFNVKKQNKKETSPWSHEMAILTKFLSLSESYLGSLWLGGWWDTRLIVMSRGEQKRKRNKKNRDPENMSRSHPRLNYTRHTLFEYAFMYNTAGDIAVVVYIDLFYPLAMGKQLKETRHKMYKSYTPLLQGKQIPLFAPFFYFFFFFPTHTATTWLHTNETVCGVDAEYIP